LLERSRKNVKKNCIGLNRIFSLSLSLFSERGIDQGVQDNILKVKRFFAGFWGGLLEG
jgi:hypothetical protein